MNEMNENERDKWNQYSRFASREIINHQGKFRSMAMSFSLEVVHCRLKQKSLDQWRDFSKGRATEMKLFQY